MILVKVLMGASEVLLIRYSFGWERSTTLDIIDILDEQDRQFSPLTNFIVLNVIKHSLRYIVIDGFIYQFSTLEQH